MPEKRWLPETLFDHLGFRMSYAVETVLYEQHTDHQHLVLFEHKHFGKMLMLDGATQVTTRDEFIYHEMMTHVPILAHGKARNVLIIGGGDCGIAEEVLKHEALKSVVQVEIDASVIVDSTDPQGPGAVLFTKQFYAACKRCMAPGGVMVTQNGVPFLQPDELISSVGMFKSLFADAACYVAAIPTYVGGHMAMGWASKDKMLRRHPLRTIAARYRRAGNFKTKYWTPEVHVAAFALPRFIAEHVARAKVRRADKAQRARRG
jgi:spermidine synthase